MANASSVGSDFFQRDRFLLKNLCRLANESLREWMQTALNETDAAPGVVLTLHTFGDYLNFHPHIHAITTDVVFDCVGVCTLLPEAPLRALRDLFRAKVFRLLVQRKRLSPALVHKFMQWKHSGFNLFRGDPWPAPTARNWKRWRSISSVIPSRSRR